LEGDNQGAKMRAILILLACGLLAGCAHNLYLASRTTGVTGTARVTTRTGQGGGEIDIAIGTEVFHGRWVYSPQGGAVAFGTATGIGGGQVATASGTAFAVPTNGNGTILASAPDGTQLRCGFNYSEWNNTGIGVCQDSHGEIYDMQIN
jgi:hypothetical protein